MGNKGCSMRSSSVRTIVAFVLPGLLVYSLVTVVPIIRASIYSFYDWNGGVIKTFIGLRNYKEIFAPQSSFWNALKNSLLYIVICSIGQVGLGFIFAILLFSVKLKGEKIFQSAMYVPCILAPVVIGFLGLQLYNGRFGLLNTALKSISLGELCRDWLGDESVAIYALIFLHVWQFIGYYGVIFLSAVQAIPQEILEVAEIDAATGIKKVWYVVAPLLRDTILVCLTVCISGTMKVFDQIFVMTKGGPGHATEVLGLYMYNSTFNRFRYGLGSAISVVIMVTSFLIVVIPRIAIDRKLDR